MYKVPYVDIFMPYIACTSCVNRLFYRFGGCSSQG